MCAYIYKIYMEIYIHKHIYEFKEEEGGGGQKKITSMYNLLLVVLVVLLPVPVPLLLLATSSSSSSYFSRFNFLIFCFKCFMTDTLVRHFFPSFECFSCLSHSFSRLLFVSSRFSLVYYIDSIFTSLSFFSLFSLYLSLLVD